MVLRKAAKRSDLRWRCCFHRARSMVADRRASARTNFGQLRRRARKIVSQIPCGARELSGVLVLSGGPDPYRDEGRVLPRLERDGLTTSQKKVKARTYRYVVVRYDEVFEDGSHQPRTLASLGRAETVDTKRAGTLTGVLQEFVRKGSTMTEEELKQHLGRGPWGYSPTAPARSGSSRRSPASDQYLGGSQVPGQATRWG